MGVRMFMRSCSCSDSNNCSKVFKKEEVIKGNPDPRNFEFVLVKAVSKLACVAEIKYLDCTNYEGRKILVFNCSLNEIIELKCIDPHFSDKDDVLSPIARFEPTDRGWNLAVKLAESL